MRLNGARDLGEEIDEILYLQVPCTFAITDVQEKVWLFRGEDMIISWVVSTPLESISSSITGSDERNLSCIPATEKSSTR